MDEAFGAAPAPVARPLAPAIKLRDDIRAKRITMKRVVAARDTTMEELREHLVLARLAPVVRDQVLGMTTVTVNELVTEEKLRFIARERNHVEQRRMYERLLAGQLRCTRAKARQAAAPGCLRSTPTCRRVGTPQCIHLLKKELEFSLWVSEPIRGPHAVEAPA
jgi:hypothetical protein